MRALNNRKNRRTIAIIALVFVFAIVITACGSKQSGSSEATPDSTHTEDNGSLHTIYFKDSNKSEKVVCNFLNSATGKSEKVDAEKCGEDDDSFIFSCRGNVKKYNVAYFTCDGKDTRKFAFNKCVSGWYKSKNGYIPYTYGKDTDYIPSFKEAKFDFNGYEKEVFFWVPEDYDADSGEKYATIYVLDGDDEINHNNPEARPEDCMYIPDQVRIMTENTGYKAIVVLVSTCGDMTKYNRDDELVPDIGKIAEEEYSKLTKKKGADLARFMAETLVPYVQKNYNVYTDALHTSVTGASLGGLETFYITMEYPEVFGTAGSQSPSFWAYGDDTWKKYLSEKDFGKNAPFIYLYTGPSGGDTDPYVTDMYNRLIDMGYPADKAALHYNDFGGHHVNYWRSYFSEFLSAMVFQNVEPLQTKK